MQSKRNAGGVFVVMCTPYHWKYVKSHLCFTTFPEDFIKSMSVRVIHMARRKLRYIHTWMHNDLSLDRGNIRLSKYYFPRCEDINSNNITPYSVLHSSNWHICHHNVHSVHIIVHKSGQLSHTHCPLSIWVDRFNLLWQPHTLHMYKSKLNI